MSVSSGYIAYKVAQQISPIILTGGLATAQGGALPIVAITNPLIQGITATVNSITVAGQVTGAGNPQLDGTGADYQPVAGGTLIDNQVAVYPFANQAIAGNAIIAQPLNISMSMLIPATTSMPFSSRLSIMMALVSTLRIHINLGGLFSVITSVYVYTNCILKMMRDVSGGETNQAQYRWQLDFFQPLLTLQAANQAQNGLMQTLTNGTPISGTPSWATGLPVNNPNGIQGLVPSPLSPASGFA
jgi:hypothetical protein